MKHISTSDPAENRTVSRLHRFWKDEEGSFTIEAVIWMPIFAIVLAVVVNVSLVFFSESQILRVVQDANRAFSLGRLDSTEAAETYISKKLAYLEATLDIQTTLNDGVIRTVLSSPATDLMPMSFMRGKFSNVQIIVAADHIVEF